METYRILLHGIDIDGAPVEFDYADVYVVVRTGLTVPDPSDWEVQIRTDQFHVVANGRHGLAMTSPDGVCLRGEAFLRFTDGRRHLFRGDTTIDGFERHEPSGRPGDRGPDGESHP